MNKFMGDKSDNLINLYDSLNSAYATTDKLDQLINIDIEEINNIGNHYLCNKCLKFPYIKFCKDRKHIRLTCSCFNNEKILIKDLLEANNLYIRNSYIEFLSTNNSNVNHYEKNYEYIENEIICKKHHKKFKGFSKIYLENYCQSCIDEKRDNDIIIIFDDIKIEDKKIEQLLKEIDSKIIKSSEESNNSNLLKIINRKDGYFEILSEEDELNFICIIKIIINDYNNFANYSHFFNIKNLLYFFNIEDKPIIEKLENRIIRSNEPIIIEYNNNFPDKTKLFSKTFVKNNKDKFKIEIEGEILDLIKEYEFKTKEEKVRIKLFLNNGVSEIDMYKMFSNCIDLIFVDGISKLKSIKIINISKIFYNCISLLSIPDINDWEIEKYNTYLMFYNCISLVFLPYEKQLNINKYDCSLLGLIITKYLNINKEIIITNIIEDNKGYINLFRNKCKIKDKEEEILIFDGKDENELIACYKDKVIENKDKLIALFSNKRNKGFEIKLRTINKIKDMNRIIISNKLKLSKWNLNSVTNISYLFYNCKSLKSLPDISNWNINNVKNMSYLFYNCSSLSYLPDISKWNINNVKNMSYLFYNCRSIQFLPDISKWNTNNVINMSYLFYNCRSLKFLPDISKWNINNVTNMSGLFYNCKYLLSLPDISKWNINNANINNLFYNCESLLFLPDISKWNIDEIQNISYLFSNCKSLSYLFDISKWNLKSVTNMRSLFYNCESLKYLPDISKWEIINVNDISYLFSNCKSLKSLPDISKWNTSNVSNIRGLFYNCYSLSSLSDISKWNLNNLKYIDYLFYNCESLSFLPDISKWITNKVTDMIYLFYNCSSLSSLPDISKWNTINVQNIKGLFCNCKSLTSLPDISK